MLLGDEASGRVPPHRDMEISYERNNWLTRFFPEENERNKVVVEYANYSGCMGIYSSYDLQGAFLIINCERNLIIMNEVN